MAKQLNWTTVKRKVNDLIPYEKNPRILSEAKKKKLMESLQKFGLAEIPAINTNDTILAGHQRMKVMQLLGRGDEIIDVRYPNRKLTAKEVKEYNITSNVSAGDWDIELLESDFADIELEDLGVEIPQLDYSEHNKEIDIDDFEDEMQIVLKYTEEEYWKIKEQLSKIAETPEQAIFKLLGNE